MGRKGVGERERVAMFGYEKKSLGIDTTCYFLRKKTQTGWREFSPGV
jgi:hypothetical protein